MYIVRKIVNISSALTRVCCCRFGLPRRRAGLGAGAAFKMGEGAGFGFGSAFATDFAVKAPSGRLSDFLTSLRTLVSLMMFCVRSPTVREGHFHNEPFLTVGVLTRGAYGAENSFSKISRYSWLMLGWPCAIATSAPREYAARALSV